MGYFADFAFCGYPLKDARDIPCVVGILLRVLLGGCSTYS